MERFNRRVFIGAAGAAGAGLVLPHLRTNVLAQTDDDPIFQHIFAEATRFAKELQAGPPTAETYSRLAAHYRLLVAYVRAHQLDTRIANAVRRAIRREGQERFLDRAAQSDAHERLKELGLSHPLQVSPDEIAATLPRVLLGNALETSFRQAAEAAEQARARLARLTVPGGGQRVQNPITPCDQFTSLCNVLKVTAAIICAATATVLVPDPTTKALCALFSVEAAAACSMQGLYC
jgi:hypothetical protein